MSKGKGTKEKEKGTSWRALRRVREGGRKRKKKEEEKEKKEDERNSGRCHSTVHKPYEILIMAALLAGILSENTLRKRRILRDDWFVNPTRYLIIRSSYEFFPSFLPLEHNFYHRFRSFNRSGGGSRLFILKEFFTGTIRSCLLFFEKKKERNHRPRSLYVALSFLYDLRDHYASSNRNLIAPRFEKSASGIERIFSFSSASSLMDRDRSRNWVNKSNPFLSLRSTDVDCNWPISEHSGIASGVHSSAKEPLFGIS